MFKDDIKNWFKKNLKPTQAQFHSFFDRIFFKDEKIPIQSIENIDDYLNKKTDQETFENHINSDVHLTVEQKNILDNLNTGCFHFNGSTLKICNLETKFNDVLLPENDRAVIFIKIPHLRVSHIRGVVNLGTLQLYDDSNGLFSDFSPRKIAFNSSVFSKVDWENYTNNISSNENIDFITLSKVTNDSSLFSYDFYNDLIGGSSENSPENLLENLNDLYSEDEEPVEVKFGNYDNSGEVESGIFIYLPKDISVNILNSVYASLDALEITFLNTDELDVKVYEKVAVSFLKASELTELVSFEAQDNTEVFLIDDFLGGLGSELNF